MTGGRPYSPRSRLPTFYRSLPDDPWPGTPLELRLSRVRSTTEDSPMNTTPCSPVSPRWTAWPSPGRLLALLAAGLLLAPAAVRADTTWQGIVPGDWFTPANWTAGVPTVGVKGGFNAFLGSSGSAT